MATMNSSPTNPRLTLSVGGVEFCLTPSDASGKVQFLQSDASQEITLNLTGFSGRLVVTPSITITEENHSSDAVKVTPKLANNSSSYHQCLKKRQLEDITQSTTKEESRPLLQHLLQQGDDEDLHHLQDKFADSQSMTPTKKSKRDESRPKSLAVDEDGDDDNDDDENNQTGVPPASQSQTQETLLAQMDLSQTQLSVMSQTGPSNDDEIVCMESDTSDKKTVVGTNSSATAMLKTDHNVDSQKTNKSSADTTMEETANAPLKVNEAKQGKVEVSAKDNAVVNKQQSNKSEAALKQDKPKKKVQKKKPKTTSSGTSSCDSSVTSGNEMSRDPVPRVSIGTPEKEVVKKTQPSPSARWGHTVTPINNNRFLVYGGQGYHPTTRLPHTLNDLYVYDMNKKTWFKPFSGDGLPRQWHTATYLPDRQLLLAFGGESMHPKSGKVRTHSNVTVLDTELMVWYPPTVSGEVPSGRSGHAAAMVEQDLVVFGGVKGSKWLNTVSVLNTQNWVWRQLKIQGSAPKPRSYHSATAVGSNRIVIFGGNDAEECFATVHVLEKIEGESDTWQWTHPMVTGYGPSPRTGHSATLLDDGHTVCIYGGWDPNDDDAPDDEALIFDDAFLLNTQTWQWTKVPLSFAKRVGQEAILLPKTENQTSTQVMAFGGRIPKDQFTDSMEVLDIKTT